MASLSRRFGFLCFGYSLIFGKRRLRNAYLRLVSLNFEAIYYYYYFLVINGVSFKKLTEMCIEVFA